MVAQPKIKSTAVLLAFVGTFDNAFLSVFHKKFQKKVLHDIFVNNDGNIQNFQCPLGASGPSPPGNVSDF